MEKVLKGQDSVTIEFLFSNNDVANLEFRDLKTKLLAKDGLEVCKDYGVSKF